MMGRTMGYLDSTDEEQIKSIFDVVKDYTYALDTLDSYDYQTLGVKSTTKECFHASYENAMAVINDLKVKFGGSELFGHEKDESFHSSIVITIMYPAEITTPIQPHTENLLFPAVFPSSICTVPIRHCVSGTLFREEERIHRRITKNNATPAAARIAAGISSAA